MGLSFKKNKNRAKDVSEVGASRMGEPFRIVHLQKLVDVLLEYVLFLVVFFGVSFWYIDNRYVCEKKMLQITKLEKELQDRKFVWLTISADLTQLSRQSEVEKVIKEKNIELKVSSEPAIRIK
ncbi:MAG: hypothetical protein IKU78_06140 [Paludibacteraceae bacterium]|nr:hypothetical protein [Paludibacteraceae bacterium]